MKRRSPYRNGIPLASQFEDGRMGIICKAEGVEFDWGNTAATSSSDFTTRCVVVRTRADRYFAVGEEVVVNLGLLDMDVDPPDFTGAREEQEISSYRYPIRIPRVVIGEPWNAARQLANDSSAVSSTHIDWRKENKRFLCPSIVSLEMPNYFDSARQTLSELEPMAADLKDPTPQPT